MKRSLTVGLVAGVVSLAAGGIALAENNGPSALMTDGVAFAVSVEFMPREVSQGCMRVTGKLVDSGDDGNSVYVRGKVHGYSWDGRTEINGVLTSANYDQCFVDPAMPKVNYGFVQACRNRSFWPDNCDEAEYQRPENVLPQGVRDLLLP